MQASLKSMLYNKTYQTDNLNIPTHTKLEFAHVCQAGGRVDRGFGVGGGGHHSNTPRTRPGEVMLNVLRCQLTYQGQVVTNAKAQFNNSLRPRKPEGSSGPTAQDGHLDSHTAPELRELNHRAKPLL